MARQKKNPSRKLLGWLAGLLPLGMGFIVVLGWIYPHQLLTVDSGEVKADALVVLGGGTDERPMRAAELFKAGAAPLILVSGTGDGDINVRLLEQAGVPATAIFREPNSISTLENARFSVPLLRRKGVHRVIIVTSWYHSRRAMACFRQVAPDLQFFSRPAYRTYPRQEWKREATSNYIRAEYFKLVGYWIFYGVRPL